MKELPFDDPRGDMPVVYVGKTKKRDYRIFKHPIVSGIIIGLTLAVFARLLESI